MAEILPGSHTSKFRFGWIRGNRNVKPVPVTKLKPEPPVRQPKVKPQTTSK